MKLDIFKILNKAIGKVSGAEFKLLYLILVKMRVSSSTKIKIHRDVILGSLGDKITARNLSSTANSLATNGYFEVEKNKDNYYTFTVMQYTTESVNVKRVPQSRKEEYQQQLQHPLWLKKRDIILNRDQHKCVQCGSEHKLQVHHTRYTKGKKAWEYPNATLVTLCEVCHTKVHSDPGHKLNPYNKNN